MKVAEKTPLEGTPLRPDERCSRTPLSARFDCGSLAEPNGGDARLI
jgi:hypothetical protein